MATAQQTPSKGGAQSSATTAQDSVKVVTDARPAEGSVIKGPATGSGESAAPSDGVVLEGLGNINEPTAPNEYDDTSLGSGEYVVVLHDLVAGVSKTYHKGDVRRISNFIPGYGDEARVNDARATAKRLFDSRAIRIAAKEEQGQGRVEVGVESDELARERAKRIELERQVEELKKAQSLDKTVKEGEQPQTPPAGNWQ